MASSVSLVAAKEVFAVIAPAGAAKSRYQNKTEKARK